MFKKMKYLLLGMMLVFGAFTNSYALDEFSTIPEQHMDLLNSIIKNLRVGDLTREDKKNIYLHFKHALDGNWYYKFTTNRSIVASKFADNPVQVVQLFVVNDERINDITFIYFKSERQILVSGSEFVEGGSKAVLNAFKKEKNKSETEVKTDNDIFAVTQEKGKLDINIYHMDSPYGMVGYIDQGIISLD